MKNGQKVGSGIEHHMPSMIAGAAMIGAAVIIGMCGMITGGAAVYAAARQWLRESDMTPSEMVKHRLEQGKAAVAASAGAWQEHNGAPARRVRT